MFHFIFLLYCGEMEPTIPMKIANCDLIYEFHREQFLSKAVPSFNCSSDTVRCNLNNSICPPLPLNRP